MQRFQSLLALTSHFHRQLDHYMGLHQECLLEQQLELALSSHDLLQRGLELHIEVENTQLFPAYEQWLTDGRWPLLVYQKEHEQLLKMLTKSRAMVADLSGSGSKLRQQILALLDYQRSLKNVVEHHEEREEQGMLPELDAALDAAQSQALIAAMAASWESEFTALQKDYEGLRLALQG
jgi:hemerythrin-like domain-containing protein